MLEKVGKWMPSSTCEGQGRGGAMVREPVVEQGVCLHKAGHRMLLHSGSSCWQLATSRLGLSPAEHRSRLQQAA